MIRENMQYRVNLDGVVYTVSARTFSQAVFAAKKLREYQQRKQA